MAEGRRRRRPWRCRWTRSGIEKESPVRFLLFLFVSLCYFLYFSVPCFHLLASFVFVFIPRLLFVYSAMHDCPVWLEACCWCLVCDIWPSYLCIKIPPTRACSCVLSLPSSSRVFSCPCVARHIHPQPEYTIQRCLDEILLKSPLQCVVHAIIRAFITFTRHWHRHWHWSNLRGADACATRTEIGKRQANRRGASA